MTSRRAWLELQCKSNRLLSACDICTEPISPSWVANPAETVSSLDELFYLLKFGLPKEPGP